MGIIKRSSWINSDKLQTRIAGGAICGFILLIAVVVIFAPHVEEDGPVSTENKSESASKPAKPEPYVADPAIKYTKYEVATTNSASDPTGQDLSKIDNTSKSLPKSVTVTLRVHEDSKYADLITDVEIRGHDNAGVDFDQVATFGKAEITGEPGNWYFYIFKSEYKPVKWNQNITSSKKLDAYFSELTDPPDQVTLKLYVSESKHAIGFLEGVRVFGHDAEGVRFDKKTNKDGYATIHGKPGPLWNFTISKEGYEPVSWDSNILLQYNDRKDACFFKKVDDPSSSNV